MPIKFKLETGVPLPRANRKPQSQAAPILETLAIGDSFVASKVMSSTIHGAAYYRGIGLAVRSISSSEMRVWRTK